MSPKHFDTSGFADVADLDFLLGACGSPQPGRQRDGYGGLQEGAAGHWVGNHEEIVVRDSSVGGVMGRFVSADGLTVDWRPDTVLFDAL